MVFRLLLFLSLLPAFITLRRVLMRRRLSISDILQIASAIFFIIVPIINLEASYDQEKGIGGFFIIYTSFSWLLLAYEWLRSRNSKRVTIIDITSYLERYREFKLKLSGQIFLLISLALVFFIYIPSQALVLRFEDSSIQAQPYEQAMTVQVLRAIYFLVGFIIILACLLDFKHRRRDVFNLTLLTLLVVCALLGVRRDLIYLVIMTSITFYALNRGRVTKKSLGVAASLFAIILFIYFPI